MKKENRKSYPSDLTDRQWKEIESLYTGMRESPSYAIIDSQSVKTTLASEERGIDGGKKQKEENDILW